MRTISARQRCYLLIACACLYSVNFVIELVGSLGTMLSLIFQSDPNLTYDEPRSFPTIFCYAMLFLISAITSLALPALIWIVTLNLNKDIPMDSFYASPSAKRVFVTLTIIAAFVSLNAGAALVSQVWNIYSIIHSPVVGNDAALYAKVVGFDPLSRKALSNASSLALALFAWLVRDEYRRRMSANRALEPVA